MRVLTAMCAGLALAVLAWGWADAEGTETHVPGFPFGCETPDGRILKPRLGDIGGAYFTDPPAQRQECMETVDQMFAGCLANTAFATDRENREFTGCVKVFEEQSAECVLHFPYERIRCDAGGIAAELAATENEQEHQVLLRLNEEPATLHYTVDPLDRMMELRVTANVRAGPGMRHRILIVAAEGNRARATGKVKERDWIRIVLPDEGGEGFIYAPLLREPEAAVLKPFGPNWSITENQPCQVWNHGNRDYEPFTWSGGCVDGKASGKGQLTYRGGAGVYQGGMHDGKMDGSGVLTWADGFRYEGELRDGRQHGRGTFVRANGDRYEGEWRDGRPHGQGSYTTADGTIYEGSWREGCFGGRDGRRAWMGTSASACGFE